MHHLNDDSKPLGRPDLLCHHPNHSPARPQPTPAGSPESYLAKRTAYLASLAAGSVFGYLAGVGDRHLQNIMLQDSSGELVHIDFG